jgi:4-hydroxymandelate oxidase
MPEHPSIPDNIGSPDFDGICSLDAFEALSENRMMRAAEVILNQGAGTSAAVRRNCAAWRQWAINSRILVDIPDIQLRTTILGTPVSLPILFAPTALHGLAHPDGEVATARAANRADTLMVLSFTSSATLEQVAAHTTKLWFQIYWSKDRDHLRHMIDRAATAGYRAICLTLDMPVQPWLGTQMRQAVREAAGIAPAPGMARNVFLDATMHHDVRLTWADLAWLISICPLPLVLKGVMTADDARLAVEHGASAIIVSNHGGRVLEDGLATADVLSEITAMIGGRIEVLVDGGIRRGSDVFKALAMGARAVLIGRPVQWGLAVAGSDGAQRVIEILRGEMASVMGMAGARTVGDIAPNKIVRRVNFPGGA